MLLFVKGGRWILGYSRYPRPLRRFFNLKKKPHKRLIQFETKSIKFNEKECLLRHYLLCDNIYSH